MAGKASAAAERAETVAAAERADSVAEGCASAVYGCEGCGDGAGDGCAGY